MSRFRALAVMLSMLVGAAAVAESAPAAAANLPVPSAVVKTTGGRVQGLVEHDISVFKGIPYGAPPIGEARFLPPRPAEPWDDVLVADAFGAPAMQLYERPHSGEPLAMQLATVFPMRAETKIDNEDALFLNVWTPAADDGKRPVLVWLHGGGYAYGSGAWPMYDGANLARKGDVVVVTLNHRLNAFGYLHLAEILGEDYAQSGNAGLLDLVLALHWVRDNVAAFGGDPDNVTIMGESGGGSKVSHLMAMPAAKGLFHKAIVQSGPGLTAVPAGAATRTARAILAELGLGSATPDRVRERLISLPAERILDAVRAAQAKAGDAFDALPLAPVVDGAVLPRHPFEPDAPAQSANVPLLIGWNKDEMTIFNISAPWFGTLGEAELETRVRELVGEKADSVLTAYRALYPDYTPTYLYNAIAGDTWALRGSVLQAERKAAQRAAPVFMYYLTWETPVGGGVFKSPHTLEIPLVFANVDKALALTGDSPAARRVEHAMASSWIAFARTGTPQNEAVPAWPPYDVERRATLVFDAEPRVVEDPKGRIRELLTR